MSKIFISFFSGVIDSNNPEAIPCFYESFIQGLKNQGNEIFVHITKKFGVNFNNIPESLLSEIKDFNPDVMFFFNNSFYDVSKEFDCPIFVYEVDSPLFYSNKEALKQNIDRYKFIVVQEESAKILKEEYKAKDNNILIAPFFTEIQNEKAEIKQNICFIGSKFTSAKNNTPYSKFMTSNPSKDEIILYKKLLAEYEKNPFLTKEELFKKFHVSSKLIIQNFVMYTIMFLISDYNRTKTLSCVSDLGLKIYGTSGWMEDNYNEPGLILNFDKTPVYTLKDNQNTYNTSKIGININHIQAKQGFSWRVCDIMASGACLVSEYKPDLVKYFSSINLPMFQNPYEARELCVKLLNEENYRNDIVAASNEIINKSFRFCNVKNLIENYFGISLSGKQESVKLVIDQVELEKRNIKPKYKMYLYLYNKLKKKLERKGLV